METKILYQLYDFNYLTPPDIIAYSTEKEEIGSAIRKYLDEENNLKTYPELNDKTDIELFEIIDNNEYDIDLIIFDNIELKKE